MLQSHTQKLRKHKLTNEPKNTTSIKMPQLCSKNPRAGRFFLKMEDLLFGSSLLAYFLKIIQLFKKEVMAPSNHHIQQSNKQQLTKHHHNHTQTQQSVIVIICVWVVGGAAHFGNRFLVPVGLS
jgi:hypothetical protein